MKSITMFSLLFMIIISGESQTVKKLWETDTVLRVPESVLFDDSVIYVSNINGQPLDKNELGFISRISDTGEILTLKWITGLNAPKGMGIYNEKLYVTDIDRVAVIDQKKGEIIQFIAIPNSKFLNDISISKTGIVAVSDMNDETIHFIENDKLAFNLKDTVLNHVNGLCWIENSLYVGSNNSVYNIDLNTKKPVRYIAETGGIDGLEQLTENRFVISDWKGKVQIVSPKANPIILFNTSGEGKNAADIDLIINSKIILVPTFFGNTVSAYQIVE